MYLYPSYGNQRHNDKPPLTPHHSYKAFRPWGGQGGAPDLGYFTTPGEGPAAAPAASVGSMSAAPEKPLQYGWGTPQTWADQPWPQMPMRPPNGAYRALGLARNKRLRGQYYNGNSSIQTPLPPIGY